MAKHARTAGGDGRRQSARDVLLADAGRAELLDCLPHRELSRSSPEHIAVIAASIVRVPGCGVVARSQRLPLRPWRNGKLGVDFRVLGPVEAHIEASVFALARRHEWVVG
jgi:hypothetical protein